MYRKNLIVQMIYRIIMCCVSAVGVLFTFGFFYVGKEPSDMTWEFLKYYTNISNYFVFAVSVIVLNDNIKRVMAGEREGYNRKIRTFKFMTTVMILVTFLVYNTMLGNPFHLDYWRKIASHCLHIFAPLLFIIDYFLFEEKKSISVYAPLFSVIIPLVYVVYIFILGAAIKDFEYPYFFLDVNDIGYGGVMIWVVVLLAVFTGLGYLLWLYNRTEKVNGKLKADFNNIKWLKMPEPSAVAPATEIAATDETDGGKTAE